MASESKIGRYAEATAVAQLPGITRRTLVWGDSMMVCEFNATAGSVIPQHQHPADQAGYVVRGQVEFTIAGVSSVLNAGDTYAIPGGIQHGAKAISDTVLCEVFSPPRDEYK